MKSQALRPLLTALRRPVDDRRVSDRQLLQHYLDQGDESAFAVLVRRHGPRIRAACRQVLADAADIDDAFQATFLVLLDKARSMRWRSALGGWLFGVAHRVALRARAGAAARHRHEARAVRPASGPETDLSWREAMAVLHEELDRLPDRLRLPLLLCYLEGLSRDEAAQQLGWTPGTVKGRLERGRERLRGRLERRGIALSAGLLAILGNSGAASMVPPRLVQTTLQAAARRALPAPALAHGVPPIMWKKYTGLLAGLLLVALAIGGSHLLTQAGTIPPTPAADRSTERPRPPKAPPGDERPTAGSLSVRGRVLGPDGKPVAGARLYALYYTPKVLPIPQRGTSDRDGGFRFSVEKKEFDRSISARPWDETIVVAVADGYGLGIPDFEPGKRFSFTDMTLRLTKDDVPITGRVLDLQGRPVAGATVSIHNLFWPTKGDLTAWHAQLKESKEGWRAIRAHLTGLEGDFIGRDVGRVFPPTVTDAEGRFRLKGVGRERLVTLRIEGPTIVSTELWAMTRPGDKIRAAMWRRGEGGEEMTFVGANFEHIAPTSRPIVGVVHDKDTGEPIPGAVVQSYVFARSNFVRTHLRTVADKDGRYRLLGMPKGAGNQIRIGPPDGQPYLLSLVGVPDDPGVGPVTVDVKLKRGVWVTGKVTDKVTGKPVASWIRYGVFEDNPNRLGAPGLTFEHDMKTRPEDGTFRFVGLLGHGVVTAQAWAGRYLRGVGSDRLKGLAPPFGGLGGFHTAVEINPEKGAEAVTCDLALDPGRTLSGTVAGPDGKPLAGALAAGLSAAGDWEYQPLQTAAFTVAALKPGEVRLLQFSHAEKKLAGSLVVRGDTKGPLTAKLGPAGTLTGRFVLPDGKPLADVELVAQLYEPVADPRMPVKPPDPTIGTLPRGLRTDKDGKFRIEGLAPGLKYRLALFKGMYFLQPDGDAGKGVMVKAGETKDLGEMKIRPFDE